MNEKQHKIAVPENSVMTVKREMINGEPMLIIEVEPKEKKPKWEDFGQVSGYYIAAQSEVVKCTFVNSYEYNRNIFPTKAEAEACLALSQLCQWQDKYNGEKLADWCDWKDDTRGKYVIFFSDNEIDDAMNWLTQRVLAFKTIEIRDKFLEDFRPLIEIAKPLL